MSEARIGILTISDRASRGEYADESGPAIEDEPDVSMSWPALGWLLALLLFLYGFGFVYGSAAYLLVCLLGNGFSWKIAVGSALVALVVTWGLFIKILGVLLPLQPLWMS